MSVKMLKVVQCNNLADLTKEVYEENQRAIENGEVLFILVLAGNLCQVALYTLSKDQKVYIPTKTMELDALLESCRRLESTRAFKALGGRGAFAYKRRNVFHEATLFCIPNLHTIETMDAYLSCVLEVQVPEDSTFYNIWAKPVCYNLSDEQRAEENGEYLTAQGYSNRLYDYRRKFEADARAGDQVNFKLRQSSMSGRHFSEQQLMKGVFCNLAAEYLYVGKTSDPARFLDFEHLMFSLFPEHNVSINDHLLKKLVQMDLNVHGGFKMGEMAIVHSHLDKSAPRTIESGSSPQKFARGERPEFVHLDDFAFYNPPNDYVRDFYYRRGLAGAVGELPHPERVKAVTPAFPELHDLKRGRIAQAAMSVACSALKFTAGGQPATVDDLSRAYLKRKKGPYQKPPAKDKPLSPLLKKMLGAKK